MEVKENIKVLLIDPDSKFQDLDHLIQEKPFMSIIETGMNESEEPILKSIVDDIILTAIRHIKNMVIVILE